MFFLSNSQCVTIGIDNGLAPNRRSSIWSSNDEVHLRQYVSLGFNSSSPSTAYMRQPIWSALVQIMACRLFGAKPLSKLVLGYYH